MGHDVFLTSDNGGKVSYARSGIRGVLPEGKIPLHPMGLLNSVAAATNRAACVIWEPSIQSFQSLALKPSLRSVKI